jgi:Rieske Fe-S protein
MIDQRVRDDFPIDWDDDHYVSRREFFKFMTLASGGLALGSVGLAAWTKVSRTERTFEPKLIGRLSEMPAGSFKNFAYPREVDMCILIHTEGGKVAAYSRRCTHLSCPVEFESDKNRLYCPCHNGAFSADDGTVLQGPPPHPLPQIKLELRGDEIYAVGVTMGGDHEA